MLPKEEKKSIENFKYWIQTNTERGVCTIPDYICINALNLLEKQQKEIKELKSKTQIISPLYIKENYISKEAIRKKIKEIEENGYWDFLEERDCEKTINILKELLGDE